MFTRLKTWMAYLMGVVLAAGLTSSTRIRSISDRGSNQMGFGWVSSAMYATGLDKSYETKNKDYKRWTKSKRRVWSIKNVLPEHQSPLNGCSSTWTDGEWLVWSGSASTCWKTGSFSWDRTRGCASCRKTTPGTWRVREKCQVSQTAFQNSEKEWVLEKIVQVHLRNMVHLNLGRINFTNGIYK